MSNSVFLQTPRSYKDYTCALRNLLYSSTDVERFLQKYDSTVSAYPVVIDDELTNLGSKEGWKRLIGFNYHTLGGIEHFMAYSVVYQVARRFKAHYYFNGYEIHWNTQDYNNFVNVHRHKAQEGRSREGAEYQNWLFGICHGRISEIFK